MPPPATTPLRFRPAPAILPLLSTTCGLLYAVVEDTTFQAFQRSALTDPTTTSKSLHLWWTHYFWFGLATISSIGITTLTTGLYTLRRLPPRSRAWYTCAAGTAFGVGHFLFGARVAGLIQGLCDAAEERKVGRTMELQRQWLTLHRVRCLVTDLPAVLCFAYLIWQGAS